MGCNGAARGRGTLFVHPIEVTRDAFKGVAAGDAFCDLVQGGADVQKTSRTTCLNQAFEVFELARFGEVLEHVIAHHEFESMAAAALGDVALPELGDRAQSRSGGDRPGFFGIHVFFE